MNAKERADAYRLLDLFDKLPPAQQETALGFMEALLVTRDAAPAESYRRALAECFANARVWLNGAAVYRTDSGEYVALSPLTAHHWPGELALVLGPVTDLGDVFGPEAPESVTEAQALELADGHIAEYGIPEGDNENLAC